MAEIINCTVIINFYRMELSIAEELKHVIADSPMHNQ